MRIGIISDTHGNVGAVRMALETLGDMDLLVHAGDVLYHPPKVHGIEGYDVPGTAGVFNQLSVPLIIAQGNCDAQVYEELLSVPVMYPYAYAVVNSVGIIASHGHLFGKKHLLELAEKFGARVAVSGHTHIPVLEWEKGIVYMNPGSTSLPKYEIDGRPVPTVGLVTDKKASIMTIPDGKVILQEDL